jgi:hypothetical protein
MVDLPFHIVVLDKRNLMRRDDTGGYESPRKCVLLIDEMLVMTIIETIFQDSNFRKEETDWGGLKTEDKKASRHHSSCLID